MIFLLTVGPAHAAWEHLWPKPAPAAEEAAPSTTTSANSAKGNGETPAKATTSGQDSSDRRLPASVEPMNLQNSAVVEEPLFPKEMSLSSQAGIPLVFNDAVDRYIHYFSVTRRDVFKRWLKRKSLYEPMIKEILQEHGLPEDLVYLAMIESGFNLQAYSPMKAAGPWQFIPETGRRYGLTVDFWVDERRDIEKSTVAAARYLNQLFNQFDCWYLAAAAYNTGENRIDRLIKRHDTKDFWELRGYDGLPRETREYVPQLIAAAIIAKNPEKYGFTDIGQAGPLEYVGEEVPGGVPLTAVAKAASTDLPSVLTLNPQLRRGITPPGKECTIKLPAGTDSDTFQNSLASILEKGKRVIGVVSHMIKRREDVSKITQQYGVSQDDLRLVNGSRIRWKRGELVYIPRFDEGEEYEEPMVGKETDFKRKPIERIAQASSGGQKSKTRAFRGAKTADFKRKPIVQFAQENAGGQKSKTGALRGVKTAHSKQKNESRLASQVKKTPRNTVTKHRSLERRHVSRHR